MLHFHLTDIVTLLFLFTAATATTPHRRLLHQPFFPLDQPANVISQPPSPSPSPQSQPQPKYPFSTLPPPDSVSGNPFFPSFSSPPPPPSPKSTGTAFATFPANISSLVLPSSSHSHKPIKLISLIVSVSLFSALVFASVFLLLLRHRYNHDDDDHDALKSDSLRLFPPDTTPSDTTPTSKKPPSPLFPHHHPTSTSSEFLYLGTLVSSRDPDYSGPTAAAPVPDTKTSPPPPPTVNYQRLGSPELQPLPPLPRQHSQQFYQNTHTSSENDNEEEEEFFSPRVSTGINTSPYRTGLSPPLNNNFTSSNNDIDYNRGSLDSLISPAYSISPGNSPSVVLHSGSPQSMQSKSPDSSVIFPTPLPRFIPPPPVREPRPPFSPFCPFSPSSTDGCGTRDCSPRASNFSAAGKTPPAPPPPPRPPVRFWEAGPPSGPPELVAPSRKVVVGEKGSLGIPEGKSEEMIKPKLKPLHWDKVRASSDRAMVWDQLKSSSFQLNEEMIETLFMVNSSNANGKDGVRRQIIPDTNQENAVLDPKKSQNIAILLRALNVTVDEVCEALAEGNADALDTELLDSLLRMAPTKEEERKLASFKDGSPFKLGTAEAFLKAVLDIPFAFNRIGAMFYIANFESEVDHLKRSFDALESACKELKSSRMFLKLLEAVLKTGNRMNIGTNRGDAQAFKLDTLLKLVDVKGADGKTTLLHFVVQEIIRAEGVRLSGVDQNPNTDTTLRDEIEFRKLGLQVVSRLSGELTNVKKAAAMDADVLSNDVSKLVSGVNKIREVVKLNEGVESKKLSDNMNGFLKKAEIELANIQAQEGIAFSMVKGLTEYFHGNSAKEEARPLRLFMVVRDFLGILDQVCKDVGKINERTMVNSGRQIQVPSTPQVFHGFIERQDCSSLSDDESSSSSN